MFRSSSRRIIERRIFTAQAGIGRSSNKDFPIPAWQNHHQKTETFLGAGKGTSKYRYVDDDHDEVWIILAV